MVHAHSPGVDNKIFVDSLQVGFIAFFGVNKLVLMKKMKQVIKICTVQSNSQTALQSGNPLKKT